MNEQPRENTGGDSVVPDKSKLVVDPEKAEAMARSGDESRTATAKARKEGLLLWAEESDAIAGRKENSTAVNYDALKMKDEYEKLSIKELDAEDNRIMREIDRLSLVREQLRSVIREKENPAERK